MANSLNKEFDEISLELEGSDEFVRCMNNNNFSSITSENKGRWLSDEHNEFIILIIKTQCDWKAISKQFNGRRTMAQIRSHAQKFFRTYKKQYAKYQNLIETHTNMMSQRTKHFLFQEIFKCEQGFAEEIMLSEGFEKLIFDFNKYSGIKRAFQKTRLKASLILVNFCKTVVDEEKIREMITAKFPHIIISDATVEIIDSNNTVLAKPSEIKFS